MSYCNTSLADQLAEFYSNNNLDPDGGYSKGYVKIQISQGLSLYFPNTRGRKRAILKHDAHHLVTGYSAGSLAGESEMGAWEIGSGCKKYRTAFFLDLSAVMLGIAICPGRVFNAFVRGRRSQNLYNDSISDRQVLAMTIGELRDRLSVNLEVQDIKPSVKDWMAFCGLVTLGLIYALIMSLFLPLVVVYSIYAIIPVVSRR